MPFHCNCGFYILCVQFKNLKYVPDHDSGRRRKDIEMQMRRVLGCSTSVHGNKNDLKQDILN